MVRMFSTFQICSTAMNFLLEEMIEPIKYVDVSRMENRQFPNILLAFTFPKYCQHNSSITINTVKRYYYHKTMAISIIITFNFRNLPRALGISMFLITTTYILVNVSYIAILGIERMMDSDVVILVRGNIM